MKSSLPSTPSISATASPSLLGSKLALTFYRSDPAVKPVDDWKLKLSLLSFLRFSLSLSIPDDAGDLSIRKRPDLHKRKREDPVAFGTLYIRDIGFLKKKRFWDEEDERDVEAIGKRFSEWNREVLEKLGGIELNIEEVGLEVRAQVPKEEDFERMRRLWE